MITTAVSDGPEGFEHRRFECLKCTVTEIKTLASDPLKSDALRWFSGELGRTGIIDNLSQRFLMSA
jgi:hypothetical protein